MLKNKFKIITLLVVIILSLTVPIVRAENETSSENEVMPISTDTDSANTTNQEETNQSNQTTSSTDNFKKEDVYLFGDNITIDYVIDGNLFIVANNVTIDSQIGGDAFILASTVNITEQSYIYSNLFVSSQNLNINGIVYDLYAASQNVTISGYVYRDVHVSSEFFDLKGIIGRNAFISSNELKFTESVNMETEDSQSVTSQGSISGNLNYTSSKEASIPDKSVTGEINYTQSSTSSIRIQDYLLSLGAFIVLVIVVWLLCLWLTPKFLKTTNLLLTKKPLPVIGLGIVSPIAILILSFILLILGITSNVGLLLLIAFFILIAISTSIFLITVNNIICNKLKIEKNIKVFASLILVSLLLWLLALIPYVGTIITACAVILGIGIISYYPFSRKIDFSKEPEKKPKKEKSKKEN